MHACGVTWQCDNNDQARIHDLQNCSQFYRTPPSVRKAEIKESYGASVNSLVAQGIEKLMQEEEEREAVSAGMAEAVRARMQTPRSEFIEMDENDTMFNDIRNRLTSKGDKLRNSTSPECRR